MRNTFTQKSARLAAACALALGAFSAAAAALRRQFTALRMQGFFWGAWESG